MIMQARQNPMAIISQRFKIPQNIQNPQDMVQHLLDSGQITQEQLNGAMRMKNNPQLRQFMK
jgi:hypothetical protein